MLKKEKLISEIIQALKDLIPNHNQDHPMFYMVVDKLPDLQEDELENLLHTYNEQLSARKMPKYKPDYNSMVNPLYRYKSYIYN